MVFASRSRRFLQFVCLRRATYAAADMPMPSIAAMRFIFRRRAAASRRTPAAPLHGEYQPRHFYKKISQRHAAVICAKSR
jgi:hypothetical protein